MTNDCIHSHVCKHVEFCRGCSATCFDDDSVPAQTMKMNWPYLPAGTGKGKGIAFGKSFIIFGRITNVVPEKADLLAKLGVNGKDSAFPHNPAHPIGTCSECGGEMTFNVPRLGPGGGYIHKATGRCLCNDTANAPAHLPPNVVPERAVTQ